MAGYRRTVMCESVRSEIRHNMGGIDGGMGSELLLSICKGRLQPTTWLEKVLMHLDARGPARAKLARLSGGGAFPRLTTRFL